MKHPAAVVAAALLLLILTAFLMPSSVPVAGAQDALPAYHPVTLPAASVEPIPPEARTPYAPNPLKFLPDNQGYSDSTISVRVENFIVGTTRVFLTWITIADPSQLRTASYKGFLSKADVNASSLANREKSVLAINGDYCAAGSNGVIIRNGKQYRSAASPIFDSLVIDDRGDFHILQAPTPNHLNNIDRTVMQSFCFGPGLVIDGHLVTDFKPELTRSIYLNGKAQRCVFCQMDELSYLVITAEGPEQSKDGGFTIPEIAKLAYSLGAKQAYNLDGGSSTWLILGDRRVNGAKYRPIADIIYFVSAEDPEHPVPTITPAPTATPEPTPTPTATPVPTKEPTPTPTATPVPTEVPTPTPSATPVSTMEPTPDPAEALLPATGISSESNSASSSILFADATSSDAASVGTSQSEVTPSEASPAEASYTEITPSEATPAEASLTDATPFEATPADAAAQ